MMVPVAGSTVAAGKLPFVPILAVRQLRPELAATAAESDGVIILDAA